MGLPPLTDPAYGAVFPVAPVGPPGTPGGGKTFEPVAAGRVGSPPHPRPRAATKQLSTASAMSLFTTHLPFPHNDLPEGG
jgi:hypothetical protein